MIALLNKVKRKIVESEFLRSVTILSTGNLVANLISFISIPILSRIYTEIAFGDYAIMTSTAAIINVAASCGLTSAVMMPGEEDKARQVYTVAVSGQFLLSTLFFIIALVVSPFYTFYRVSGSYALSLGLVYIYVLLLGLYSFTSVYVNRLRKNRVLFWNALINSSALFCFTIPFGLLGWGSQGFLLAATIGYLIADIQMLVHIRPFKKITISDFISICKEFKNFTLFQYPSNLIATFSIQLPNQLFSSHFGNASLGGYAMCERLLGVPMRLIGAPITTVYFRHSSMYVREGQDLSAFTYQLIKRIFIFAFIPAIILLLFSNTIFTFVLGDSWSTVGVVVSILILPYVLAFGANSISYCFVVINKQRVNLFLSIAQLFLTATSIIFGSVFDLSFIDTVKLFALSSVLFQLLNLLLIFYFLKKHFFSFLKFIVVYLSLLLLCYFIK